jgi:predicted metalloendopeptidase
MAIQLETALARASRSQADLRDPLKNYNNVKTAKLIAINPAIPWKLYLAGRDLSL